MSLDINYLKARLDPEEILGELGIDMAYRLGPEIMCHCPNWTGNHQNGDLTPSFGFNTEKLTYNCFVCGGGSLVQLVCELKGFTERQAEGWLIEHSNLEPKENEKFREEIERILNPIKETEPDPEYPKDALFQFNKIHPYLLERGISKEILIEFQVGYDEAHYGITIPHFFMGNLKGWQTRHLVSKEIEGKEVFWCPTCEPYHKIGKIPKYKNTPNFPKINTLYGYDQAMAFCRKNKETGVILVESPLTVLYLVSHGYHNAMATFGSFNYEQAMLVIGFDTVYYWPDNDRAGWENSKRGIKALEKYVNLKIVPVVDGSKNDAANLHPDAIQEYIMKSYPASLFDKLGLSNIEGVKV